MTPPARLLLAALLLPLAASASSPQLCERAPLHDAAHHARRLQLAAQLRHELEAGGAAAALVARSGVDLSRFGLRHSHAGVALRANPVARWAVRQLYYACDESRPRLFDQGLAGFLLAADEGPTAWVSVLLLPAAEAAALEAAALDARRALPLLGARYSANAHAYSVQYQNCNQWLAELLAAAWGGAGAGASRERAQAWLRRSGYEPHRFEGHALLFALSGFVPLLHHDDHPEEDLQAARLRVSVPASIERFVLGRVPGARRIELCQDERHIVVRRGGSPPGAGCEPAPGDEVLTFEPALSTTTP